MPGGQNEAVAIESFGMGRGVALQLAEKRRSDLSATERQAEVATLRGMDSVDCEPRAIVAARWRSSSLGRGIPKNRRIQASKPPFRPAIGDDATDRCTVFNGLWSSAK